MPIQQQPLRRSGVWWWVLRVALAFAIAGLHAVGSSAAASPAIGPGSLTSAAIRIGAVFPSAGEAGTLAGAELAGVRIAAELVNAEGGVAGRPIEIVLHNLESRRDAPGAMASLAHAGVEIVVGAYSSDLSMAASRAADAEGILYWEAGAVADRLTGRGFPMVFRVGASGASLGANSARFAASELAPRLDLAPGDLRIAVVSATDRYARSVAGAAIETATAEGTPVVARLAYDLAHPDWPGLMADLAAARPDVVILASHIPDGIAFRRAMLAADLRVGALIGSTMAECDPDFAGALGPDAVGIFASDRPTGGFQPGALDAATRDVYESFVREWTSIGPPGGSAAEDRAYGYGGSAYTISGPGESRSAEATEEALSGFAAGWALFDDVLPAAAASGSLDAESVARAARAMDLPRESLPNGAGLRFSSAPGTLGQNERAAAVIWQWQAVRTYAFVWPETYATGTIGFVPLPR